MVTLRRVCFFVLILALAVLALEFQGANARQVYVRTLIGDIPSIALGDALLWTLMLGFGSGLLLGGILWQIKSLESKWLRRKLKAKESS